MENNWRKQLQEVYEQLNEVDADIESLMSKTEQLIMDGKFLMIAHEEGLIEGEDWDYGI